ncbi:MAG TPA: MBL fold metallo-hydrolase [Gammaproteobacteria bacterium]|nr:MBL fold metallo-hydrolase [Gammaproteobacteria bacterium]
MRFASLGSGSRGNATLVEADGTCLLVDCGFSVSETRARLARLSVEADSIAAILVTHEHTDHASGVARVAARFGIPVWCTAGTLNASTRYGLESATLFNPHDVFSIGAIEVTPVAVPHDAREPAQFIFSDGQRRFGMLTDTGHITPHIERVFDGCDALLIECNHDAGLLMDGPYPPSLKARVGGPLGHLSNAQAAALLATLDLGRLQHLVAAHLSDKNNTPALAQAALAEAADCEPDWIAVADQLDGLDWRSI